MFGYSAIRQMDFVAVKDSEDEKAMRLKVAKTLSYELTPVYIVKLRASVSCPMYQSLGF